MTTLQDGTVLAAGGDHDDIKAEAYDPQRHLVTDRRCHGILPVVGNRAYNTL
jgi:hypothetical protein